MKKSIEALVKSELLVWARKTSGFELIQAANKIKIKPELLESWEKGEKKPTISQLRKLGKLYKRPLAVFYLSEPPYDFQPLKDFRRFPSKAKKLQSPELLFEIRKAQSRRELAIELFETLDIKPSSFSLKASLSDDAEELGDNVRKALGINYEEQTKWASGHEGKNRWTLGYEAFNKWRSALEKAGVLVFQATDVSLEEARGFSISDSPLPAIVVNIKDTPRGRTFTMLHELTHIVLNTGGVCDLLERKGQLQEEQRIEIFCNRVAGAALVPRKNLLNEELVKNKPQQSKWIDDEIRALADKYGVSREVILRRLLIHNFTTEAFYQEKQAQYQKEYEKLGKIKKEGFAPPHRIAMSSAGPLFVRLVLDSFRQDKITASDLADFLDIRLKHLGRIERESFAGLRAGSAS